MKILLLGEISALHKNLKEGLVELGHEVVLAGGRDSYKMIPVDISFTPKTNNFISRAIYKFKPFFKLNYLVGYDVVQICGPFVLKNKYFFADFILDLIRKKNKKFFLLAAGNDGFFWMNASERLKYNPLDDFLKTDRKGILPFAATSQGYDYNKRVLEFADGLIPIMYEYEKCYEGVNNKLGTIPIPINTDKVVYKENIVNKKLVVFHGLSRYGFKGTKYVEEAFSYLKEKYPNDLELIIDGKMPLDKYLGVMARANVVIDQTSSYSLGVNGVYALAMGKIVMGGAEPESLKSLGVARTPVINIKPDAQSIIVEVEKLLLNRNKITEMGLESRRFVEDVHGHRKVASQYLNAWTSISNC